MERIYVESTNLSSVGYDEDSCTLEVEFHKGGVYQYYDVPKYVFEGLMAAQSKGSYFDQNVKKENYTCKRV
ncbi:KTSC domain-containing protein [Thalassospira alkalitolerans]|uniref:KTSC domain-containing protein n=1 Tax=Thalassospira alkalitolerans TaxID=1293890 RepID=UPI003AA81C2C